MKLKITISKTAQGDKDYLQVMSDDAFSVNVVLLADEIEILDTRKKGKKK